MRPDALKGPAIAALIAVVAAVATYAVSGSEARGTRVLEAAVALVVVGALALVIWAGPRLAKRCAILVMRFIIFGMKSYGESSRDRFEGDTLWEWFTDQLLVAQHRYAFSVGCIAFDEDNANRCLLVKRPFPGFAGSVLLWPGGRFRGALEDFEGEIRRLVKTETGCSVTLLSTNGQTGVPFARKVDTYNPRSEKCDLENNMLQSPILVMQQNRRQSHDVPGHIDLIYIARVARDEKVNKDGMWLDISEFDKYETKHLWPDTRRCIEHAASVYADVASGKAGDAG